jgi:hypothetical protein
MNLDCVEIDLFCSVNLVFYSNTTLKHVLNKLYL